MQVEDDKNWKTLWNLHTTTKIKTFGWKLLHKRLPIFDRLQKFGLKNDAKCILCNMEEETVEHIFHKCDYTIEVWRNHLLNLKSYNLNIGSWRTEAWIKPGKDATLKSQTLTLTTFWPVWKARNARAFKGEKISLAWTSKEAISEYIVNYETLTKEMDNKSKKESHSSCKWEKPKINQIKVNTDCAWDYKTKKAGIGYIMRDCKGEIIIAASAFHLSNSALYSEIMAIRNAMAYFHSNQGRNEETILIESDSMEAVNFIKGRYLYPPLEITEMLKEIEFMGATNRFDFNYASRQCNRVANWLAVKAKNSMQSDVWFENWPLALRRLMLLDLAT